MQSVTPRPLESMSRREAISLAVEGIQRIYDNIEELFRDLLLERDERLIAIRQEEYFVVTRDLFSSLVSFLFSEAEDDEILEHLGSTMGQFLNNVFALVEAYEKAIFGPEFSNDITHGPISDIDDVFRALGTVFLRAVRLDAFTEGRTFEEELRGMFQEFGVDPLEMNGFLEQHGITDGMVQLFFGAITASVEQREAEAHHHTATVTNMTPNT